MKGYLEGLESSWDSPGLGQHYVEFPKMPEVGQRFFCSGFDYEGFMPFSTGTVQQVRKFGPNETRFKTKRTTYVLRLEATNAD